MIENLLKEFITKAIKERNEIAKNILRLALGTIQLDSSKNEITEDQKINIIKKIIKSNETTIEAMHQKSIDQWSVEWQNNAPKLAFEIKVLMSLLPNSLTLEQTKDALSNKITDIKAAKSDGQAIGISIKYLKSLNALVDSATVKIVVDELRKQ